MDEITGRVIVGFEVDEQGRPEDVQVLRGVHPAVDAEAVRVVREHARFVPTCRDGQPLRVQGRLPISFSLR